MTLTLCAKSLPMTNACSRILAPPGMHLISQSVAQRVCKIFLCTCTDIPEVVQELYILGLCWRVLSLDLVLDSCCQ